jgi:curli biogenesis system outer membrane secretion channel CsgG
MRQPLALTLISFMLWGCATTIGPHGSAPSTLQEEEHVSFPPYQGPKRRIQVVQISISADDVKRYPELAEKRVGFGLSSILVETLFDTGRFTFLEEKEPLLKRLVELWELSEDGILVQNPAAQETALQAPEFLVYAEVFDFVACSPLEHISPGRKQISCLTSVGVQVRVVNIATGEYIPGSTNPLSAQGKYRHTVNLSLFAAAHMPFDQSAVGKATLKATRYAVLQVLQRLDQGRW